MAMELKFVAPKMEETFGKLTFAGVGEAETAYVNGRTRVTGRSYHLFSTRQRADDVVVTLPATVGEKHFGYDEPVVLINARLSASGRNIEGSGYTDYKMTADDMVTPEEAAKLVQAGKQEVLRRSKEVIKQI